MTKTKHITDNAKHIEVIPKRHREAFCNTQGAGRYTGNWIFGWPTQIDRNIFAKSQTERILLKKMQ